MTSTTTASFGTSIPGAPRLPTLENHFFIELGDEYEPTTSELEAPKIIWKNPHLNSAITPFIPSDTDIVLINSCNQAFANTNKAEFAALLTPGDTIFWNHDVTMIILSHLNPEIVFKCCTRINKCFYLAIQNDTLWKNQLSKILPKVNFMPSNLCTFSPKQQFTIVYNHINDQRNPYLAKFEQIQKKVFPIENQIRELQSEFEKAGGSEALERANKTIIAFQGNSEEATKLWSEFAQSKDAQAQGIFNQICVSKNRLSFIVGESYNGTIESIDFYSDLGQILYAINVLIPAVFNKQAKFEEVIQQAEALKNTASSNDGPIIEDVTDHSDV